MMMFMAQLKPLHRFYRNTAYIQDRMKRQLLPVDNPAYIGAYGVAFSGSRNGFSALLVWNFLAKDSVTSLTARIKADLTERRDFFLT
jgi:hypothetical protein